MNAVSSQILNLILLVAIVVLKLTLKIVTRCDEEVGLAVNAPVKVIVVIFLRKWWVIIFAVITRYLQNVFINFVFSLFHFLFLLYIFSCNFFFLYHLFYFIKVFIFNKIICLLHFNFSLFFFKFYFLWSFALILFFNFSYGIFCLLLIIFILFYFLRLLKTRMT